VWTIGFAVALACSLASVVLASVSAFKIGSWCILCVATYGINFFLVFLTWIIRRRFEAEPPLSAFASDLRFLWTNLRWSGPVFSLFGAALVLTAAFFPAYWELQPPGASADIRTGMTADGYPWIGAENPELEIVEFTDYQCFQCRKMHHFLLQLLARYPGKIRLVHRDFPMDQEFNPIVRKPFHVGSGRMALMAIYAANQGKFAEMNDWLFSQVAAESGSIRVKEAAIAVGLDAAQLSAALQYEPYRRHLMKDIYDGLKLGVVGTPSYLINGHIYEGNLPADVLKPVMEGPALG
jgi:protein-disulfide isomerase